jgi:POT family proton-dependent oligopeptide transporter
VFHTFVMGVYFFPLVGGFIADRWLGRYRTILWVSGLYVAGHALLAVFDEVPTGFYAGLALIAVASGGIKPCVSAFVGDQFDQSRRHLARLVFDAFYWVINFGSFFATLLAPVLLARFGPAVAFGVPGALMAAALGIFWWGRHTYVRVPPTPGDPTAPARVAWDHLRGHPLGRAALGAAIAGAAAVFALRGELGAVPSICLALVVVLATLGLALWHLVPRDGQEHTESVHAVLRMLVLFALVTPFWSLFDQKASTWVLQGGALTMPAWMSGPAQMQALNPLLVLMLIPVHNAVLYPLARRLGVEPTPLRRMTTGIALAGIAWLLAAALQLQIDAGAAPSIGWQAPAYVVLTVGEVLVSATGLEFAYSQAPMKAKGTLMAFWSLSVTVGNLWVLLVDVALKREAVTAAATAWTGLSEAAFQMAFFAGFAFVAAAAFGLYAARMPVADRYRAASA